MSVSSFQPLNPRQLDLQRRLLVANELREPSLIAQLELQWVHRYGVSSLPKRTEEASPDVLPSPKSSEEGSTIQALSLVNDPTVATKGDEAGVMEDLTERSSNPPLKVAPPPIALGAQRFRRWMVASSADQDRQAS